MPTDDWLPAAIRERSRVRELAAEQLLFRQGDKALAIFEIEHGRLRLIRNAIDSHRVVLHTARAGELFAEAALFSGTYHCDAVADVASRVRAYPKRELLSLFRVDPLAGERFMAALARQVHGLRARLEERNIRSAREHLLHHLALCADADGRTMPLEGTLMDLAAEIGLTHEALYRTLSELEKEVPSAGRVRGSHSGRSPSHDPDHIARGRWGVSSPHTKYECEDLMSSISRKILTATAAVAMVAAAAVILIPALHAAPPADSPPAVPPMTGHQGMSMGDHSMGAMPGAMQHDSQMGDMMQQHQMMMSHMQQMHANLPRLPGQDAFGAIQEVVRTLDADPRTDWSKVDLEALRQHLIDMNDVTLQAGAAAKPIDGGLEITVTGTGRTLAAIQRMVPAHAAEIDGLNGWGAKTRPLGNGVVLIVTATDPKEVQHIRGLGFIGILVSGSHHQAHHLAMAKGEFQHDR